MGFEISDHFKLHTQSFPERGQIVVRLDLYGTCERLEDVWGLAEFMAKNARDRARGAVGADKLLVYANYEFRSFRDKKAVRLEAEFGFEDLTLAGESDGL